MNHISHIIVRQINQLMFNLMLAMEHETEDNTDVLSASATKYIFSFQKLVRKKSEPMIPDTCLKTPSLQIQINLNPF